MQEQPLQGVVLTEDDLRVPGASVWLSPLPYPGLSNEEVGPSAVVDDEGPPKRERAPSAWSSAPVQVAITDERGLFKVDLATLPRFHRFVTRLHVWAQKDDLLAPDVRLRPWSTLVKLVLARTFTPRARTVDEDGRPLPGCMVSLSLTDQQTANHRGLLLMGLLGVSDAAGLVEFVRVPDSAVWAVTLRAGAEGRPIQIFTVPIATLRESIPTLQLARGATVRGSVVLPDGQPGGDVAVEVHQPYWGSPFPRRLDRCAPDGTFLLTGVPVHGARLRFTASLPRVEGSGHPTLAVRTVSIEGVAGKTIDLGPVGLQPAARISGRVLQADGTPATSGSVRCADAWARIEGDGRFVVEGLEPGCHDLDAHVVPAAPSDVPSRASPFRDATVAGVRTGSEIVIHVTGGGNLLVRFHEAGAPGEALAVLAPCVTWGHRGASASGVRTEFCCRMAPGTYDDIEVCADGYRRKRLGQTVILADRPTFVDVELEPELEEEQA